MFTLASVARTPSAFLRGGAGQSRARAQRRRETIFRRGLRPLCIANKIDPALPSFASLRPRAGWRAVLPVRASG